MNKENVTEIIYKNSHDCGEGLIINFENIQKVIELLSTPAPSEDVDVLAARFADNRERRGCSYWNGLNKGFKAGYAASKATVSGKEVEIINWLDNELDKAKDNPEAFSGDLQREVWIAALMHVKVNSPLYTLLSPATVSNGIAASQSSDESSSGIEEIAESLWQKWSMQNSDQWKYLTKGCFTLALQDKELLAHFKSPSPLQGSVQSYPRWVKASELHDELMKRYNDERYSIQRRSCYYDLAKDISDKYDIRLEELDDLVNQFRTGNIDLTTFSSRLWNEAYKSGKIENKPQEGEERMFTLKEALAIWEAAENYSYETYSDMVTEVTKLPRKEQYFKQTFGINLEK